MRKPKRYVLVQADGLMKSPEVEAVTQTLRERHGDLEVTLLEAPVTSLIVKTDRAVAEDIRESLSGARFGERTVSTVLTSGNIGKLKRLALRSSAREDDQVLQR